MVLNISMRCRISTACQHYNRARQIWPEIHQNVLGGAELSLKYNAATVGHTMLGSFDKIASGTPQAKSLPKPSEIKMGLCETGFRKDACRFLTYEHVETDSNFGTTTRRTTKTNVNILGEENR